MNANTVVLKYQIPEPGAGYKSYPNGKVVAVAFQGDVANVWIEHTDDDPWTLYLRSEATGRRFDKEGGEHVGSAISDALVWHVYAVRR